MEYVQFCWLGEEISLKDALKATLGCSGQQIKKYFSSKEQDRIITAKSESRLPLPLVNHLQINPEYVGPSVTLIAESEDFLALHKPGNVHCHPHSYEDRDTILNFLVTKGKWDVLKVNERSYDRGLLYRLDYETSGVLILAKKESIFQNIRMNFDTIMKRKFYWAVVEGEFDKNGRWTHYFKATGAKGVKQKVLDYDEAGALEGTLSCLKITSNQGKSLVLVNLKSGLRHQIRAQLAHLGFPILGDELYGGKKSDRLFLHALRYEFLETIEDPNADLFGLFFDLNGALEMSQNVLGRF